MNLSDYFNSIARTKKNVIRGSDSQDAAEKAYPAFVVARTYSYQRSLLPIVDILNTMPVPITNLQHYEFLLGLVPKGNYYSKWEKVAQETEIKKLAEKLDIDFAKAREYVRLLTDDQIDAIMADQQYGGVTK